MKNIIKGFMLVIIIIAVSFLMPSFMDNTNYTKAADEGTFTILEIVPYKGMGEAGYLVGHQEPVDKELLNIDSAADDLSFLDNVLSVYPSYVESPLPSSGNADQGWDPAWSFTNQNGYFEYVGYGGNYRRYTNQTRYDRVPEGTGSYVAVLDDDVLENINTVNDPYYTKNVKAYFVFGLSTGIPLYNDYVGYEPYSVTENPTNTGNYDYDYDTGNFLLNKGNGAYDVLFESVNNGRYYCAADYEVVEDNSGDYYCSVYYDEPYHQDEGNYDRFRRDESFGYIDWDTSNTYRWVQDDEALNKPNYFHEGNKIWVKGYPIYVEYQYTYQVELINHELFKRFNLGIPSAQVKDYPVEVITITPEELNLPENYHLIEEADYCYINANYNQNSNYIMLYEDYSHEGQSLPDEDKYADNQNPKPENLNFAVHDLSWSNVEKIFMRAAGIGGNKAAVVFDDTFYRDAISDLDINIENPYDFLKEQVAISDTYEITTATMCNLAKLYIMVNHGDPVAFYNSFMNLVTAENLITEEPVTVNLTGLTGSFVNPNSSDPSPAADAAIYWNNDTFLPIAQEDSDDATEDGTEGSNLRTFKRVLNIQPTADFGTSETMIRTLLDDYDVKIVNMTSNQFNGCIDDINTRYDMIYMGGGAGRFNNSGSRTDFNDGNLDSYYYFVEGDIILNTDGTESRYRGNDITAQKKRDLENFIAAGYPIVLESSLYQLTNRVKNNTNIYSFINTSKNNSRLTNFLNAANYQTSTFISRLNSSLKIVRPIVQLLEPEAKINSPVNYIYVSPVNQKLTIKFALLSKGIIPSSNLYDAALYLDKNGDGIFDASEVVQALTGGESWVGISESSINTYTNQYDMSGLNGVYQWKLIIKSQSNGAIRSEITGFAANNHKKSLYILQITESSSAYNLESKVNDSASLIYSYAGNRKLNDYNLVFETMTVQEFENQYYPAYNPTKAATNHLAKYHLLILDNPITAISNANGACSNIKAEITNKLGVIYTKNALGYVNQANYFSSSNYSFLNNFTYNRMNRNAQPDIKFSYGNWEWTIYSQMLIFRNFKSADNINSDTTYQTTYLTKTNEGAITRYPYKINQAIEMAENSYSNYTTIDYDLVQNKRLIGWYSLSDSKSPVIRDICLEDGENTTELYQGFYSSSPNDVKNNYYLFSNGWCFYSGIRLATADQQNNDNEMKLFVNTIITAYQASKRVISTPPVIEFIDPVPVFEPDSSLSITIPQENIVGSDVVLTFEITESLSNMDLKIWLNASNPAGSWNETIYKVAFMDTPIPIDNTTKAIAAGTYAIKIPTTELSGEPILKLTATNVQGDSATSEVKLKFIQYPIVTIVDPVPIANASTQCIYVDIDFNAIDEEENYLNDTDKLRVVFNIDKSLTTVFVSIESNGVSLISGNPDDVSVFPIIGGIESETEADLTEAQPKTGTYALYIPMSLMKGLSSRDITITADSAGLMGNASVTLLRRSLFPLD